MSSHTDHTDHTVIRSHGLALRGEALSTVLKVLLAEGSYAPFGAEALPTTHKLVKNAKTFQNQSTGQDSYGVQSHGSSFAHTTLCLRARPIAVMRDHCRAGSSSDTRGTAFTAAPTLHRLRSYADTTSVMIWRGNPARRSWSGLQIGG